MREFDDFTIFKRTLPSSKNQKKKRHVYCYYPIDNEGNRYSSYFSTGKTTLVKARKY